MLAQDPTLADLPDGIHSGWEKPGYRGLFFYFTAPDPRGAGRLHFWRYYDLATDKIHDNRYEIAVLIRCQPMAYAAYQQNNDFPALLTAVQALLAGRENDAVAPSLLPPLQASDLHLVCWEYVGS